MHHSRSHLVAAVAGLLALAAALVPSARAQDATDNETTQALAEAIAALASEEADAVAGACDTIRELAQDGTDVGAALRQCLTGRSLEAAVRAAELLVELGLPLREPLPDATGDGDGDSDSDGDTPEPLPPPQIPAEMLRGMLTAPARVALHADAQVGQACTYALGDPGEADADARIDRETIAIVATVEPDSDDNGDREPTELWIELRYTLIDPVVVLLRVDRDSGRVREAFGGHRPREDELDQGWPLRATIAIDDREPPAFAPAGTARLVESDAIPADAETGTASSPAGDFEHATRFTHSVRQGASRRVRCTDWVSGEVYFDGLVRRVHAESGRTIRLLERQHSRAHQTVWPDRGDNDDGDD